MGEKDYRLVEHEKPWKYKEDDYTATRGSAWTGPGCHEGCGVLLYTDDDGKFHEFGRVLTTPKYSAYIRIGEGCDNWCSYCAIPMIRGGYRSRPKADILAEVRKLAAQGVKEFTLIAQDTTRYGTDDGGESQLPQLIEEIAAIPGVEWLRALYCYPGRAPAGYDEAPAERLRLPRSADAAHQPAYPDRYEPHGHQRAHPRGLPHVQGARHDAAHDADGRLPRRNGGRF